MHFKSLFTLSLTVSLPLLATANTLASSNPEQAALDDVQALNTDLTDLDNAVQKWDGDLLSAMSLKQDAISAQEDIDKALEDAKQIESIAPESRKELADALREMKPRAVQAVRHLVDKQSEFEQIGLNSGIADSLKNLKYSMGEFEAALKPKLNSDDAEELSQALKEIRDELDKAIRAFS